MRCTYITLLPGVARYVLPFRSVRRQTIRLLVVLIILITISVVKIPGFPRA